MKQLSETYLNHSKYYKDLIDELIKSHSEKEASLKTQDEYRYGYTLFDMAKIKMFQSSLYMALNSLALHFTKQDDKTFLNDARKNCSESINYVEKLVTKYMDVPFSDYEDNLAKLDEINISNRLVFFEKLGFLIDTIRIGYGDSSKWKWIFTEMEGRFSIILKNFLDLKKVTIALSDPGYQNYRDWVVYSQLVKDQLSSSADKYKQKYEIFSKKIEDFAMALTFLQTLKRYQTLIGDTRNMEILTKKIEVWKGQLEKDHKKSK